MAHPLCCGGGGQAVTASLRPWGAWLTAAQAECRNIYILLCLAKAGIVAHVAHKLVHTAWERQGPGCLLGYSGG